MPGDDGPSNVVWRLQYADDYQRTDEGWRFRRREADHRHIESRPVAKVRE